MKVQVYQLFFKPDAYGGLLPVDDHLFTLATKYAEQYMAYPIDFTNYKHSWVACELDEQGQPVRALGILGMTLRADFTLCRFTDSAAVLKLVQRGNDILHDMYGARGTDALIHMAKDEVPEQHCPNHEDWMQAFGLVPADRWAYKVR
jgi:hypothetical protein